MFFMESIVHDSHRRAASLVCLCLMFGWGISLADSPAAPTANAPGVWQKHEYSFSFLGFTSTYSCDGLADKLKILLIASGARPDVKARPGACASGFGRPDKFARADLAFYSLSPLTGAQARNDAPVVGGTWRSVALTTHSPRTLALGDCELVEQFQSNLLPLFSTRNVVSRTTCVPYQDSGSAIDLQFEAFGLIPAPRSTR